MNKKNKNMLADALNNIALDISLVNYSDSAEVLKKAKKTFKLIELLSKKYEAPCVRALVHWMLLNTEQQNNPIETIKELAATGSYFNWIEILAALLQTNDPTLHNEFYNSLQTPNWIIKPSALLLKDLKNWIDKETTHSEENQAQTEILSIETTQNTINHAVISSNSNPDPIITGSSPHKSNHATADECMSNLSLELDMLIMNLIEISSKSDNVLHDVDKLNNKLEHLIIFATNCSYKPIAQIGRWCQRNLELFARDGSQRQFIESGESWSWIELLSYYLSDSDGHASLSSLSDEFKRTEWLEPINLEDLQGLLLFLHSSKQEINVNQVVETNDIDSTEGNTDNGNTSANEALEKETGLSFKWDEDIHPELLAAYLEETPELVIQLSDYLKQIQTSNSTEEERQTSSRMAHTIKGSSAVLGITALSKISYQYEMLLDFYAKKDLSDEILEALAKSADCFNQLFDSIKNKTTVPAEFITTLETLSTYAENLEEDDTELTLSAPKLPDFIQQQHTTIEKPLAESTAVVTKDKHKDEVNSLSRGDNRFDIDEFNAEIEDIVMSLSMVISNPDDPFTDIQKASDELQRLDLLAEISGYAEISSLSQWCQKNLTLLQKDNSANSKEFLASGECWTWIELISASLSDPTDSSYLSLLSQELMRAEWPEPISQDKLKGILLLLNTIKSEANTPVEETNHETQNTKANSPVDELSSDALSWDEDIHPELLSTYLQETPDQIAEAAQLIQKISACEASQDEHQQAARIIHTIKGSSGVVGIQALAKFTHKLEDVLEHSITNQLPNEVSELLTESADCLEDLFEAILNKGEAPREYSAILSKLSQYADTLEDGNIIGDIQPLETSKLPDFINLNKTISDAPKITPKPTASTQNSQPAETHIKVPIAVIDKLLNLTGELVIATTQITDKIDNSIQTNKQIKVQDQRVHKMLNELSRTILQQEKNQTKQLSTLKNSNFDSLEMDTYNELHSIAALLTESILDSEAIDNQLGNQLTELTEHARSLELLNAELSEQILNSRMVSINSLVPKLERIIRQTCRKTGKKAELAVSGNDIHIDTDILNNLADPLLHLLRNSIDHGIEAPTERKLKGKYETGRIHLTFSREGKYIQMELKDDGAGINPNKIYHQAQKMGLIDPNKDYTEKQILQLILRPGFSTQKKVTDISGRGVGMDVVSSAVQRLKGTLEISSTKDEGTTFSIKVPLTLVTSATLLVDISGFKVAIPSDSIEQLYYLSPGKVIERNGAHYIQHNDTELPIISLAGLLDWPAKKPDFSITNSLLLIKGDKKLHAVYVDEILQAREIVIKSLEPWVNSDNGVIGACHLPDGGIAPVINTTKLLSLTEDTTEIIKKFQLTTETKDDIIDTVPQILVVDDSLSNRKALSLIIEQTEYDVLTAVDGLDALQIMNENDIDIVYTDLEMPRMNGLELTQAIRAWEAKKRTPVVMITSRTTKKHKQLAEKAGVNQYLTKPVIAEVLLESIEVWLKQIRLANIN